MKKSELKKTDLILALCCYIVFEICDIVLTIICFMTCWPVSVFTILFAGFIGVMIISTVQQLKGKNPIIKQVKTESSPHTIYPTKKRLSPFWKIIGVLSIMDEVRELNEPVPLKNKSILNSTCYDNEHLHTEEGHETENGYCMECDLAVEDILE